MLLKENTSSKEKKVFQDAYLPWTEELNQLRLKVLDGGSPKAKEKHLARGKWLPRKRINALLDHQSMFLEIGTFAGHDVYPTIDLPSAGLIAGIGYIYERPCMIIANDPTVKGGTYFPLTVKKHLRAQEIANNHNIPCIYLVDSGGAFLPMQDEVFPDKDHFGRIFYNEANMSAKGIPQFAIILGSCTAGGAYIPAMADESIMVKNQGTIFLAGPPLVKAATGELISEEELGGSGVHCRISGLADLEVNDEKQAFESLRERVRFLPKMSGKTDSQFEIPKFSQDKITSYIPNDPRHLPDIEGILGCILDGSRMEPFKPQYGTTIICGFAKIKGHSVGILANNGILTSESAMKSAHFIQICCKRKVPIVFFQNINGFIVGGNPERKGIAKHGAKMVMAVSNATVPKYTVVIGGSYGAGNYAMCGRAFNPQFLWQWPNAKIAVMGGAQAASVMSAVSKGKKNQKELAAEYEKKSKAIYGSARLWDDGIIHPSETREILGFALDLAPMIETKPQHFGIFRM